MASKLVSQIDEALIPLLNKGLIVISDEISGETADYINAAITLCRASDSPPIQIIIDSPGGDLYASLTIHDILCSYEGGTTGIVIGSAASGANLILQGCEHRIATENSVLYVHNMIVTAKYDVLKDKKKFQEYLDELVEWQNKIYSIYRKRTSKTRRELQVVFRKEKLLTPEKALDLGFIDEIIDPNNLKNGASTDNDIDGEDGVFEFDLQDLAQLLSKKMIQRGKKQNK